MHMHYADRHAAARQREGYARLTRYETDRARWYPRPGDYLADVKRARAILAEGGRIRMDWCSRALDAAGFEREMRAALHRRISAKGGQVYSRYNSPHEKGLHIGFRRDARALRDHREQRVRIYGFETRAVRERFGDLVASRYDD